MKKIFFLFSISIVFCHLSFAQDTKLILSPFNSTVEDAVIASIIPDENRGSAPHNNGYAWTQSGIVNIARSLISFDLSSIPATAVLSEAKLVLYYNPFISTLPAHSGTSGFYVNRIIEPWEELSVTWNTQPLITTDNEVYIPFPSYDEQNFVIDVTAMVTDMLANPTSSDGFMIRLEQEEPYNVILLCSRENEDMSRHPKLLLSYDPDGMVGTNDPDKSKTDDTVFSIAPNPAKGMVNLVLSDVITLSTDQFSYTIIDEKGQQVVAATQVAGANTTIEVSHLVAGNYFIIVASKQQETVQTIKFIKI
jgi:hypothetical protein